MYRLPCVPSSATWRRIAVRNLVLSRTGPQPALPRSTLTSRMTSFSWPVRPGATAGALVFFVVTRGFGFRVGVAFRGDAVRVGEGDADGVGNAAGPAGRAAPSPGTPPPAPGARAATAAAGNSAGVPGPVRLAGSSAEPSPNAPTRPVTGRARATGAGIGRRPRCRPVGPFAAVAWSPGESTSSYTHCLRGPGGSRGFDPGDGKQWSEHAANGLRKT